MVNSKFCTLFLFFIALKINAQDTTITFTKSEFQKVKFLKQALGSFPTDCKINYYKMSITLRGSEKTAIYDSKDPASTSLPNAFLEIIKTQGGEILIDKLKTSCVSNRHNKSFKIIVN